MKRKVVTCDICGEDITFKNERYKFKIYENSFVNMEDLEFTKWRRLDMCESCFFDLLVFVDERGRNKK